MLEIRYEHIKQKMRRTKNKQELKQLRRELQSVWLRLMEVR